MRWMVWKGAHMEENKLLGVCGLYCGACNHYRAYLSDGRHLLEEAFDQGQEVEPCQGCRSSLLTKSCAHCSLRDCAADRNVLHCGMCSIYPCDQLKAFQHDGRLHHLPVLDNLESLKQQEPGSWLAGQAQRWQCRCGSRFSWYEEHCRSCGASLASYGFRRNGQ
jgi:hypothetical protein